MNYCSIRQLCSGHVCLLFHLNRNGKPKSRLNYRQFLSQSTGNAMDLDVIRLGDNPSSHRQGHRLIFLSSARTQLQSAHNIAPMEVNVTKTMQMHTDGSFMDEPKLPMKITVRSRECDGGQFETLFCQWTVLC